VRCARRRGCDRVGACTFGHPSRVRRVRPIAGERGNRTGRLIDRRTDLRAVINLAGGQFGRDDPISGSIHAEVRFPPGSTLRRAMLDSDGCAVDLQNARQAWWQDGFSSTGTGSWQRCGPIAEPACGLEIASSNGFDIVLGEADSGKRRRLARHRVGRHEAMAPHGGTARMRLP
jgi:hypothetical protein